MNDSNFNPQSVTLDSRFVCLEPLCIHHAQELYDAGQDESLWRYMPCPMQKTVDETQSWIQDALNAHAVGAELPFVIRYKPKDKIIGSTRFLDIQPSNSALEIGWTWLSKSYQGTGVNAECKLLLMQHAFENLCAVRVQLKTDARNLQSQRAMQKLGFVREGVLRKSRLCWDGHYRDTVYFSVLADEWPDVKKQIIKNSNHCK